MCQILFARKNEKDNKPDKVVQSGIAALAKKKPRGKPFTGVGDPRNNLKGRPKTGEALAEHIRVLLDSPMKRTGTDEESTVLDEGLIALANAFLAGDPAISKLLLDRGWGRLPEMIMLSKHENKEQDWKLLTPDEMRLVGWVAWVAAGRVPEKGGPYMPRENTVIDQAIKVTRLFDVINAEIEAERSNPDNPIFEEETGKE